MEKKYNLAISFLYRLNINTMIDLCLQDLTATSHIIIYTSSNRQLGSVGKRVRLP